MKYVVCICLFSVLFGCTTIDPYSGEGKTSNATKGAGIGAISGAVIGALAADKKDRDKAILTGAVSGAAIGGGIGYYMDVQEAKLREELQGTGVQVRREGNNIHLVMPGNITFASSRYEIKAQFYPVLDSVAKVLAKYEKTLVIISGHTDSTGSLDFNETLSENRAQSVRAYLTQRNVDAARIQANGYGPRYPVSTNKTAEGRRENRRVEIKLEPIQ